MPNVLSSDKKANLSRNSSRTRRKRWLKLVNRKRRELSFPGFKGKPDTAFRLWRGKKVTLDVACETDADFEAWIVALNRAIGTAADWSRPMEVERLPLADTLDDE